MASESKGKASVRKVYFLLKLGLFYLSLLDPGLMFDTYYTDANSGSISAALESTIRLPMILIVPNALLEY